jgi:hypothetical protein
LLTLAANETRRRAIEIATLTLVAALGGLLFLSRESFGLDEAFSVELAGSGWQTLWEKLSYSEINGSPYYLSGSRGFSAAVAARPPGPTRA